jgi:hypothetical protein
MTQTVEAVHAFVAEYKISVLNVAGSRTSNEPEFREFVQSVLSAAFLEARHLSA